MADTLGQAATRIGRLADAMADTGVAASHAIGRFGRETYMSGTTGSGLLPASLAATHGKIRGRNRRASVGYNLHHDANGQSVTITPRGDLWWVRAQGREAKGQHTMLRFTKKGVRPGRTKRSTPPLAASPQLYQPAQARVARESPRLVDAAVVDTLRKAFG